MSKSFEYGNLTASSASAESHINEIKHYSGIKLNIRVDDFIKYHTSYLEGKSYCNKSKIDASLGNNGNNKKYK